MNAGMAYTHDSHFGPPSELIDISGFIQSALDLEANASHSLDVFSALPTSVASLEAWDSLSEDQRSAIESECDVSDLQSNLKDTWNNPTLLAHLMKGHEATVSVIHESADRSNKRKRKRAAFTDPSQDLPEATALQKQLDSIPLQSWPLMMDSAVFMRPPKNSDFNALLEPKKMASDSSFVLSSSSHQALVTLSVHNRLGWGNGYWSRSSQHVVLSSQTLGDLFDVIPCPSNEIPEETTEDGQVTGYQEGRKTPVSCGYVLCIEGLAYGDGLNEKDYADKLIDHFATVLKEKRPPLHKAPTAMHDTPFSSLKLRLNEPYWLLHQGNCEHFIVVDQIRLQHPTDPPSGYPLTVQITPLLLDVCRVCSKVPAVLSVVGDIRLGESPCVLCNPCWRNMGQPGPEEDVVVIPLPKHELGW